MDAEEYLAFHLLRVHDYSEKVNNTGGEVHSILSVRLAMAFTVMERHGLEEEFNEFEERLAAADPFSLYCVCLESLKGKFEQYPSKGDEFIRQFIRFLNTEIKALHELERWPVSVPTIAEIL